MLAVLPCIDATLNLFQVKLLNFKFLPDEGPTVETLLTLLSISAVPSTDQRFYILIHISLKVYFIYLFYFFYVLKICHPMLIFQQQHLPNFCHKQWPRRS